MKNKKNIFFIWLGDSLPINIKFVFDAFQLMNPCVNCSLIHKSIDQINEIHIYSCYDDIDQIFLDSIFVLKEYNDLWKDFIDNQIKVYGKDAKFIQVLSDIFRVILLQKLGGIYVDCDTYPVKQFDDSLFECPFCVMSYQANATEQHIDNYFFGMPKGLNYVPYDDFKHNMRLISQTYYKQQSSIGYYERKMKFNRGILSINDFPKDFPFYIEHYPSCNWKNNPSKIPFCKYDFSDWFINLKKKCLL